jgi:HlyD family secretion protein
MSTPQHPELPLEVIARQLDDTGKSVNRFSFRRRYLLILLVPVLMFSGAVIGMYFQPPALQKFYALTGLQPGAGSKSPIALPPEINLPKDMVATMQATDVVGLARLIPRGDIYIVAPPFGAGDARIAEILVSAKRRSRSPAG